MYSLSDVLEPGTLAESSTVTVTLLAQEARFSLRAAQAEQAKLSAALGVELPGRIARRVAAGGIEALCLAPDEWLILASESRSAAIARACADIYPDARHSMTEISDRELSVRIEGREATALLTLGCPRDIGSIGTSEGRRTVFDGASAVLWRDGDQDFRMDVWRSFAPHVFSLLKTGCVELAAE